MNSGEFPLFSNSWEKKITPLNHHVQPSLDRILSSVSLFSHPIKKIKRRFRTLLFERGKFSELDFYRFFS
ncbi:MAG: hypothetical protein CL914_16265 [Deltaproteobacteria bacterium]|nr:hypothetical protein [Deltaproteobacteria bacterium]